MVGHVLGEPGAACPATEPMELKRGRGRPRLYPQCDICKKSVKPDDNNGQDKHKKCDHPDSDQAMFAAQDESLTKENPLPKPKRRVKTTGVNDNGGFAEGFTAREAGEIITNTMCVQRHVIKYEHKFYIVRDPEDGVKGNGYENPTALLGDFLRVTGILKIGDQMLVCASGRGR